MERIFVAMASYRDRECQWTLKDLFAAARFPERVSVGICWQFDSEQDQDCFVEPCQRPEQVRTIEVTLAEARGACWAKAKALSLASDEEYVLLIDSHMRFAPGWDEAMVDMLYQTGNARAFLSTYPAGYEPPDQRRFNTPRLAPIKFFDRVMSMNSVLLEMEHPMPSYLVAGGYLFGHREMFSEVPYDPHIYFIGEEVTHAARYYTHGWDGYTPSQCLIHHYYERKSAPRHWNDDSNNWSKINLASYKRVRHILEIERTNDAAALLEIERYGLGSKRSLTEFQAAIGVNFNAMLIDRKRQESVAAIEQATAHPFTPRLQHKINDLGTHASRHGHFLFPQRDAYIGKSMIEYGEWTEGQLRLLAGLFPPGAHVLEIGACFGAHTIPLARLAGAEGQVTAVEQSRRMVDLLHANLALNQVDNVRVVHVRVDAEPGAVEVVEPNFRAECDNFGVLKHKPVSDYSRSVRVTQLDAESWGAVDCLIVDTPGESYGVLAGARRLLRSHRPVLVTNADHSEDANQARHLMEELGYRIWHHACPFFAPDNFFFNPENHFGRIVGLSLVGLPDDRDISHLYATRAT